MPNFSNGLLKCAVSKGMFPDEYAVEFSTDSSQVVSLFASKEDLERVDDTKKIGFLRVTIYGAISQDIVSVLLPSETLEQGRNIVNVPRWELETV
jgi:hypothetical protein